MTTNVHYLLILFLNPVSNCPIFQDGCKNAGPARLYLWQPTLHATVTARLLIGQCGPSSSLIGPRLSSQNLRETRQSNHCTGVTEIADLCVTTPSLNMNRFRIKSATASRDPRHSDEDCLSDHNGVYSFSSSSWWEAGGDYKLEVVTRGDEGI